MRARCRAPVWFRRMRPAAAMGRRLTGRAHRAHRLRRPLRAPARRGDGAPPAPVWHRRPPRASGPLPTCCVAAPASWPDVLVLPVASAAPRLLHVVLHDCHDHVVRDAALARTVVIQNVTEPRPALLHQVPPEHALSGGVGERDAGVKSLAEKAQFTIHNSHVTKPRRPSVDIRPGRRPRPAGWWIEGSSWLPRMHVLSRPPGRRPRRGRSPASIPRA